MKIFRNYYKNIAALIILQLSTVIAQESNVSDPDPLRYSNAIESFEKWDAKNSYPENGVLFVGSSSIRGWASADAFPGYDVINRGFGGSHISDVIYFYDRIVMKYRPEIIVFYAGDNDIAAGKNPRRVAKDFEKFSALVQNNMSDCKLIFLAIKPSTSRWEFWPAMVEANSSVAEFTKTGSHLFYADIASPMLDKNGNPDQGLFINDGLHLNSRGYEVWKSVLEPILAKIDN